MGSDNVLFGPGNERVSDFSVLSQTFWDCGSSWCACHQLAPGAEPQAYTGEYVREYRWWNGFFALRWGNRRYRIVSESMNWSGRICNICWIIGQEEWWYDRNILCKEKSWYYRPLGKPMTCINVGQCDQVQKLNFIENHQLATNWPTLRHQLSHTVHVQYSNHDQLPYCRTFWRNLDHPLTTIVKRLVTKFR